MGKAKRKLFLFKKYRRNLELLSENLNFMQEALHDIVICPICFHRFKESDVNQSGNKNYLTIEHVPPRYLGGTVEVLTCFKCNNLFSEFDSELCFVPYKPDSKVVSWRAKVKSEKVKFGAITEFDFAKSEVKFVLSNEEDLSKFVESIRGKSQFNFVVKDKTKAVGTNLMKMAYLLAFNKFGYGLIMQPQYNFIRAQINKPYETLLGNHGILLINDDHSLPDGIFLLKEPKEFISLFVRFRLKMKDGTVRSYSILLPSPGVDVLKFYDRLKTLKKGTKFSISDFGNVDFWHDRNFIFGAIQEIDRHLKAPLRQH